MSIKTFGELAVGDTYYNVDIRGNRMGPLWKKLSQTSAKILACHSVTNDIMAAIRVIPTKKKGLMPGEVRPNIPPLVEMSMLTKATEQQISQYLANAKEYAKHFRLYGDGAGGYALIVAEYMAYQDGYTLRDWP